MSTPSSAGAGSSSRSSSSSCSSAAAPALDSTNEWRAGQAGASGTPYFSATPRPRHYLPRFLSPSSFNSNQLIRSKQSKQGTARRQPAVLRRQPAPPSLACLTRRARSPLPVVLSGAISTGTSFLGSSQEPRSSSSVLSVCVSFTRGRSMPFDVSLTPCQVCRSKYLINRLGLPQPPLNPIPVLFRLVVARD